MKHLIIIFAIAITLSCSEDFLDKKPDKSIIVPTTLEDMQSLLDNNVDAFNIDPSLGFIGSDDYTIAEANWQYLGTAVERNGYIWNTELYEGQTLSDWNTPYRQVFYANVILEQLENLTPTTSEQAQWNILKGSALFYRSTAFFNLLEVFADPYEESSASSKMGVPLRLTADINAPITRASIKDGYDQVIADLEKAIALLPTETDYRTRPSKAAAFGMLARVYLSMSDYENALDAVQACLELESDLMDYNELNPAAARPIAQFNAEVIYHSTQITYGIRNDAYVNADLFASYDDVDLRKVIFVNNSLGVPIYKGWYSGLNRLFSGIATDEMYLIRAECNARLGDKDAAMNDVNLLLEHRYASGTFNPLDAKSPEEALAIVLKERRKELLFRSTRWSDLRRLNRDPAYGVTLSRTLNGVTYTLPENDERYTYPIPSDEIIISGIAQNPR